jgi:hypothetical protein
MPVSSELFLAILAMDAYNRGYNAGIVPQAGNAALGLGGVGSQIGNATVTRQDGGTDAQSASFFAQSYTLTGSYQSFSGGPSLIAGEKIISYRGTDSIPGNWGDLPAFSTAVGNYDSQQARLAIDFYKTVNGGSASTNSSIVTTGHSLGGGLAGYVGALHGLKGMVFDNMAFELAAQRAANDDAPCALQAGPAA